MWNYTKLYITNPCVLILGSDDYKKRSLDDSSSKSESDSLGIYEHVDPIKFTDDGSFAEHVGTYKRFADDSLDADATATSALSSLVWRWHLSSTSHNDEIIIMMMTRRVMTTLNGRIQELRFGRPNTLIFSFFLSPHHSISHVSIHSILAFLYTNFSSPLFFYPFPSCFSRL